MKRTAFLIVALVSLCIVQVSAINLSYNFKVGSSYAQSNKTSFTMSMDIMGQKMNIGTVVSSRMTYTVLSVKDTCYEIDVRYDSIDVSMNGLAGYQNLNTSLSSAQDQLSGALKQFINKTFQLTLSKKGKVVDVRNYEALFSAVDTNDQVGSQLKQNFSKETFLTNMEAYVSFFPTKPVNKGDSWTATNKMATSGLPIEAFTTYTLKDVTSSQYIISGVSTTKTDKSGDSPIILQGMKVDMDIKGGITYEMALDKNTGWLKEMTGKIDMDATLKMDGDILQGQNLVMKIKGDIVSNDR